MPKIIPIRELRDTSAISEMCHSMDEPVFVTKNGYGDIKFTKGKGSNLKKE